MKYTIVICDFVITINLGLFTKNIYFRIDKYIHVKKIDY